MTAIPAEVTAQPVQMRAQPPVPADRGGPSDPAMATSAPVRTLNPNATEFRPNRQVGEEAGVQGNKDSFMSAALEDAIRCGVNAGLAVAAAKFQVPQQMAASSHVPTASGDGGSSIPVQSTDTLQQVQPLTSTNNLSYSQISHDQMKQQPDGSLIACNESSESIEEKTGPSLLPPPDCTAGVDPDMREAEKAVLRNFYLLAQDHDHQMKVKDDLIRELMTHKTGLEKSLHEAQNDQSLYKMAKEHDAQMNQLVDTVRVLQNEKAELEISVHQLRAEQEKMDLDSKVRSTEINQLANKVKILEDEKAEMEVSLEGLKTKQEIRDLNANKVGVVTSALKPIIRALECICCYGAKSNVKVYQCQWGHLICEHCRQDLPDKIPQCPACQAKYILDIRCLLAEELANSLCLDH